MIIDFDDMGCSHVITDICRSNDCRDKLDSLHYTNPNFKVTLFAIPGEMTAELANWCSTNNSWVELCVHGFYHSSNYECSQITYEEFDKQMKFFEPMINQYFIKGFRSPGWQTSDGVFRWLNEHGWWVSSQSYDLERVPKYLWNYMNSDGQFGVWQGNYQFSSNLPAYHGHVWNVGEVGSNPNGIYENYTAIESLVKNANNFQFISEAIDEIRTPKQ